jgi:integrase
MSYVGLTSNEDPTMRAVLTKKLMDAAQPQAKPYELRDANVKGLILRVQPSGHKAWICEWARGKRRTLGAYSHLTLEQARAHVANSMAEHIQRGLPSIAKKTRTQSITLQAFLDDHYSPWACTTLRGGVASVRTIKRAFPDLLDKRLDDLQRNDLTAWVTRRAQDRNRYGQPLSRATLTRLVAALRASISKAVEWGHCQSNPFAGMKSGLAEPRKIVRFLSPDERARLRSTLAHRDQRRLAKRQGASEAAYADHLTPLVVTAMNTGLRRGELLALTWADVDLDAKMLTVRSETAKNGKQRHVPLNTEAFAALTLWKLDQQPWERVFPVPEFKTAWGKVVMRAALPAFRFHDLRHDFASQLVARGVDLNTVRELLGHADITMTLRYAHLAPEHLAAAVNKLG